MFKPDSKTARTCDLCGQVFPDIHGVVKHQEEDGCEVEVIAALKAKMQADEDDCAACIIEHDSQLAALKAQVREMGGLMGGTKVIWSYQVTAKISEILNRPEVKALLSPPREPDHQPEKWTQEDIDAGKVKAEEFERDIEWAEPDDEGSGPCSVCQTETTYTGEHNRDYGVWLCPDHGGEPDRHPEQG